MYRLICVIAAAFFVAVNSQQAGDCNALGTLFQIGTNNRSVLIDSLSACPSATFPATQCIVFRPYIIRIDRQVVRNPNLAGVRERVLRFNYMINQFIGQNIQRRNAIMQVQMNNGWGSVQQIVNCIL
ncbi:hypothetical protein QR680_019376 [Steinernema hermaphroditum]|uniref:Uncharacterized protein n=1 Tax=Steinernema hermaphroditum TaxID=289476 RepID=A0AA39GNZ5_9BILA|nr:hypothetical protein QR680_019376 [Steinernema hermaphroditum]